MLSRRTEKLIAPTGPHAHRRRQDARAGGKAQRAVCLVVQQHGARTACLVEIVCEDGTVGWGECFGPAALNAAIVAAFRPHLVGADPLASDRHWMHLYNLFRDQGQKGLAVTALSGVDVALWDIKGKHFGAPIHVLMGGPIRLEVRAYATGTYRRGSADPLGYIVEEVQGYAREGFPAVKLKIGFGVTGMRR